MVINIEFKVNKPYPKIKIEKKNIYYANILLNDYSGIISELSAITQYIYQYFNTNNEISIIFKNIAIVEMKHLELLGKTIKLLGINPKFNFINNNLYNNLTYWNGNFIDYNTNINCMIKNNILMEEKTICNYKKDILLINDKYIKNLLNRIIEDEYLHIKIFKELKNREISL